MQTDTSIFPSVFSRRDDMRFRGGGAVKELFTERELAAAKVRQSDDYLERKTHRNVARLNSTRRVRSLRYLTGSGSTV